MGGLSLEMCVLKSPNASNHATHVYTITYDHVIQQSNTRAPDTAWLVPLIVGPLLHVVSSKWDNWMEITPSLERMLECGT